MQLLDLRILPESIWSQLGLLCLRRQAVVCTKVEDGLPVQGMLGIFQKLIASRVHDQDGFRILEALLDNAPPETLQPYIPQVRLCPYAPRQQYQIYPLQDEDAG